MSLSRSEEETLEEQILDCCVREEWEEAKVTLAGRTRWQKGEGGPRKRKDSEDAARGFGVGLEKESPAVSLARHRCYRCTMNKIGCFFCLYLIFSVASIYRL